MEELKDKAARFLNEHTDPALGVDFTGEEYSLETLMLVIERRADGGDPDCDRFLEEEVPWEDLTVPDPLGYANKA